MDKISEILRSIKTRLSAPLFASFIVSWILCNWKVTVALLWYNSDQVKSDGHNSLLDLIEKNTSNLQSIGLPILFACLYTFAIRNLIEAAQSATNKWGESLNLWVSKGSSVPIDKFLKLRAGLKEKTDQLERILKDESKTLEDFEKERSDRQDAEIRINELTRNLIETTEILSGISNTSILNGRWKFKIKQQADSEETTDMIYEISNTQVFVVTNSSNRSPAFDIRNFFYHRQRHTMFFVKEARDYRGVPAKSVVRTIANLEVDVNEDILYGTEDGFQVWYERQTPKKQ